MEGMYSLLQLTLRIYFNEFEEILISIMREKKQTINVFTELFLKLNLPKFQILMKYF